VRWLPEQDYLLVYCRNGSLSLWEIGSGQLHEQIWGEEAKQILESAPFVSERDRLELQSTKKIAKQAISCIYHHSILLFPLFFCSHISDLPVSGMLLNLKHISYNIFKFTRGETSQLITSTPSYKSYAYLLPWFISPELDANLTDALKMSSPTPRPAYGLTGTGGTLSVLLPHASEGTGRWQHSDTLSATHSLSAIALSKSLLTLEDHQNICSQMLSYFAAILPEQVPGYVSPSLTFLARYWQDPIDDIMQSARSIFIASLDSISLEDRQRLAKAWGDFLKGGRNMKSKALVILVLGILGTERPDSLSPEISEVVATELLNLLFTDSSAKLKDASIELLGKGFDQWNHHISEVSEVIQKLFQLSLMPEPANLASMAHHALLLIGSRDPGAFIQSLSKHFGTSRESGSHSNASLARHHIAPSEILPQELAQALLTMSQLIKKYPSELLSELPLLIELIVQSLDPHVPFLRDACLKPATQLIHDVVRRYPMATFDAATQRLAVGGKDEPIVYIYDLTSATKWNKLEGHKSAISAATFSETGKLLATYSMGDCEIKLWQMASSFFGLLGSSPHCVKTIKTKKVDTNIATKAMLIEAIKLQFVNKKTLILIHAWEKEPSQTFTFHV